MRRTILLLTGLAALNCMVSAQALKANFTAKESTKEVYKQGFDSSEELKDWVLQSTNESNTWHLAEKPNVKGIPPFSSIVPESKYSLAIWYDDRNAQDETIHSPEILIPENGKCSFYLCFSGGFLVFANLTVSVTIPELAQTDELFDAFKWAQEVGYDGPKWVPFSFDLSKYAGRQVFFSFKYKGKGGEDMLIDDFRVVEEDHTGENPVKIVEGATVHFMDLSEGSPASWEWTFEGGEPASSTEQNPVVGYAKAGTYPVKLTVKKDDMENACQKEGFVVVRCVAPTAKIGFPSEGYLSPWVACYVPLDKEVHFTDCSEGFPTAWEWQLQGSDREKCYEQNPVVTYRKKGLYSLSLRVTNDAGTHTAVWERALQAGGEQYIWNISAEENQSLAPINLGFYGYYGGTNWIGMTAFAEHFDKPAVRGTISKVAVYFASVATITPDTLITVSVAKADAEGMPGEVLATAAVRAGDLQYSDDTFKETFFEFKEPVVVEDEFFIVISGIPANSNDVASDDIALFCSPRREDGGKSTVYHQLAEEDDNYQPTGEYKWYKNVDEFLSFALTPLFAYEYNGTSVEKHSAEVPLITVSDGRLRWMNAVEVIRVQVYSPTGQMVYSAQDGSSVSVAHLPKGVYLVKAVVDGQESVQKVSW